MLLAICDAKHNFTLLDVEQYGNNNDAGVLANSLLGQMLKKKQFFEIAFSCTARRV